MDNALMIPYWLAAGTALLVLYGSLTPGWLRPRSGLDGHIEHLIAYAVLGFSILVFVASPQDLLLMQIVLIAVAAAMETAQRWIPGRSCRLSHFLASCAGTIIATLTGAVLLLEPILAA